MKHANPPRTRRAGFTLMEMLFSMTMMVLALSVAIPFFMTQSRALTGHAGRMDTQLGLNFTLDAIDRDLRVAGVGVVQKQPMLVQLAPDAITFNVDLASAAKTDFASVYWDPDAPIGTDGLLFPNKRITLPNSAVGYPDSAYWQSPGAPSAAETISYWVEPDPTNAPYYRVMRRANNATPDVIAKNIKKITTEPFFRYSITGVGGALAEIPAAKMPLIHVISSAHGSPADTARSALADSVVQVVVRLTAVYKDPVKGEVTRNQERNIRLNNAGLILASTCGEAPLAPPAMTAVANATPAVVLTWTKSIDDGAGEKDVERYGIYRRLSSSPAFEDSPIANVVGGLPAYSFTDTDVTPGSTYVYGILAQDCNPLVSPMIVSAPILIP